VLFFLTPLSAGAFMAACNKLDSVTAENRRVRLSYPDGAPAAPQRCKAV
jgi:hypothetical protein